MAISGHPQRPPVLREHMLPPSPPMEPINNKDVTETKRTTSGKSAKPSHRISKRASTSKTHHHHPHSPTSPDSSHSAHSVADGRHKRVWKACERCRMKKTKCDGEFPCKRCKDDGLVCTAGTRKKTEFKQLSPGYAEVLEHTQLALVATVHKLYAMVRSGEQWDFGEPDLNDRGQPVVHNIAQKLGCIRPNSDIDLPVHSVFPEDEQGLASLASQLEAQQQAQKATASSDHLELDTRTDRASSSDDDHSDAGDFQKMTFSGGSYQHADNTATLSPASLTRHSFDMHSAQSSEDMSRTTSPTTNTMPNEFSQYFGPALMGNSFNNPSFGQPTAFTTLSMLQSPALASLDSMDIFSQSPLEPQFSPTESHAMGRPNPDLMFSEDPMLFANLDVDMRPVTSGY